MKFKEEIKKSLDNLIFKTHMNEGAYILLKNKKKGFDYPIISIEERLGAIKALKWVLEE